MSFKKFAQRALLVSGLVLSPAVVLAAAVIGQPAPAFTGQGADGKSVSLGDYRGKTVVLEWTNHDCPFVKKHYVSGNIPALQKSAAGSGVVWLQVISSAPGKQGHVDGATALKLNAARGATPQGVILDADGKIGRLYEARTTPHIFIVNQAGVLVYKGGIDSIASADPADIPKAENYVKTALAALAAGTAVNTPISQPYGCGVKYAD